MPRSSTAGEDGRLRRAAESRERILRAIYDLVRETERQPSMETVASRAGVSVRTVYRHFEDIDGLHAALSARAALEVGPLLVAGPGEGTLAERLEALVAQRVRIFEALAPFRRAQGPAEQASERLHEQQALLADRLRELSRQALGPLEDEDVALALEAALGFEAWDHLRRVRGLGPERARRVLLLTASRLVEPEWAEAGRAEP